MSQSFFGSAIPSVSFDAIGDEVRGKVISTEIRQQRDIETGELLTWPDGRVKEMAVVMMETHEPANEDDSGLHNLYVRGFMQNDVRKALRQIHSQSLDNGMWLDVNLMAIDAPRKRGMKGARHFNVEVFHADDAPEWATNWPPKADEAMVGHVETGDDSGEPGF